MSRSSRAVSLVALLLLANFAYTLQLGRSARTYVTPRDTIVGRDNIANKLEAGDLTIRNMAFAGNSLRTDFVDVPLPRGLSYQYLVVDDITSVTTWFKLSNSSGHYDQQVLTWSNDLSHIQAVPCGIECQWSVDASGFSVFNPMTEQIQIKVGWNGPL